MQSLNDLLIDEIKDLYSAEKQIVKALPKMVKGAQSEELRTALSGHLEQTKEHVTRLEESFNRLEHKPQAKLCKGMEGLLAEGAECLESMKASELRDLAIIGAAQRVEHYEMAAYGTARAMATELELDEVVALLSSTYDEEQEADEKLSAVAEQLYTEVARKEGQEEMSAEEEAGSLRHKSPKKQSAHAAGAGVRP